MFLKRVAVGHPGEVITNGAMPAVGFGATLRDFTDRVVVVQVIRKEFFEKFYGAAIRFVDFGIEVEILVEVVAKFEVQFFAPRTVLRQGFRLQAHVIG